MGLDKFGLHDCMSTFVMMYENMGWARFCGGAMRHAWVTIFKLTVICESHEIGYYRHAVAISLILHKLICGALNLLMGFCIVIYSINYYETKDRTCSLSQAL